MDVDEQRIVVESSNDPIALSPKETWEVYDSVLVLRSGDAYVGLNPLTHPEVGDIVAVFQGQYFYEGVPIPNMIGDTYYWKQYPDTNYCKDQFMYSDATANNNFRVALINTKIINGDLYDSVFLNFYLDNVYWNVPGEVLSDMRIAVEVFSSEGVADLNTITYNTRGQFVWQSSSWHVFHPVINRWYRGTFNRWVSIDITNAMSWIWGTGRRGQVTLRIWCVTASGNLDYVVGVCSVFRTKEYEELGELAKCGPFISTLPINYVTSLSAPTYDFFIMESIPSEHYDEVTNLPITPWDASNKRFTFFYGGPVQNTNFAFYHLKLYIVAKIKSPDCKLFVDLVPYEYLDSEVSSITWDTQPGTVEMGSYTDITSDMVGTTITIDVTSHAIEAKRMGIPLMLRLSLECADDTSNVVYVASKRSSTYPARFEWA